MATNVTFNSLMSDLQAYLERGTTTDTQVYNQLPRLINAAERKIIQFLKLQGTIEVLTDASGLASGVAIVTKPDRWRQTVSMFYGAGADSNSRTPLYPRSYEYCRRYWPDDSVTDANQPPLFYADYDYAHWLIAPTPPQNYPLEVLCYMQPQLLDAANQSNFFTDWTPNLLLYGALLEAVPFLKNDPRIQVWQGLWQMELQSLAGQDLQRILDRAAERSRP